MIIWSTVLRAIGSQGNVDIMGKYAECGMADYSVTYYTAVARAHDPIVHISLCVFVVCCFVYLFLDLRKSTPRALFQKDSSSRPQESASDDKLSDSQGRHDCDHGREQPHDLSLQLQCGPVQLRLLRPHEQHHDGRRRLTEHPPPTLQGLAIFFGFRCFPTGSPSRRQARTRPGWG